MLFEAALPAPELRPVVTFVKVAIIALALAAVVVPTGHHRGITRIAK